MGALGLVQQQGQREGLGLHEEVLALRPEAMEQEVLREKRTNFNTLFQIF